MMRKTLTIALLVLLAVALLAAPALAQRDPFDPAIGTASPPPQVDGGAEPEPAEPEPQVEPPADDLADTGFAAQPFVVLAYILVAAGIAALAVGGVARRPD